MSDRLERSLYPTRQTTWSDQTGNSLERSLSPYPSDRLERSDGYEQRK